MLFVSELNGQVLNWKIQHPTKKNWIDLGEKGTIQEAFINAGLLPDPFVGENEKLFTWMEKYNWTFESTINLSSIDPNEIYQLDFPSLDTYAEVFVNDKKCGEGENAFVHYFFTVTPLLKVGENKIKIVFTSPVLKKKKEAEHAFYPAPNDVGDVKVASHCRKPQYHFGWDWALRMVTIGMWKPAQLIHFKQNRVVGKNVVTHKITDEKSKHTLSVYLSETPPVSDFIWKSKLFGEKKIHSYGTRNLSREEEISNPKLWWPRGHGEQYLYEDEWTITTLDGTVIHTEKLKFGVRTSEIVQQKDEWGTSFEIHVNGKNIFCKGADYIPDDVFLDRITDVKLRKSVQTMADCNFNMVRIWGGGNYAEEVFMNACDELGIMVWHDFMFACAMYPGDQHFLDVVQNELEQQIPRLSSHASLILFNGNNEVDVAWKNWGFQEQYKIPEIQQVRIVHAYDELFRKLIPNVIRLYSEVPYEHTSPLSNWGTKEFYNHGTQHYWGVWHGKEPMTEMGRNIGRFNAEYGFQSFPEYSTLNSFSTPKDWKLDSKVMKSRQKSYIGNGKIKEHSDVLYGETKDFKRFVYYSQLTQSKAVEVAVNAHRLDKPRCSGTLFWQMNDCWPAISWSSIDYFGNWKALQYKVKEAYKDVTVLKDLSIDNGSYYLVSDMDDVFNTEITCEVKSLTGEILDKFHCSRVVTNEKILLFETEIQKYKTVNCQLSFTYTDNLGSINEYSDLLIVDNGFVSPAKVEILDLKINDSVKTGEITISNSAVVSDFWIYSTLNKVHFENNFLNLLPETHILKFSFEGKAPVKESFEYQFH